MHNMMGGALRDVPERYMDADPRAKVLVADDDSSMRRLVAGALRRDGYDVVEAADGADLFEALGTSLLPGARMPPFDLIVTDLSMPYLDGLHVLAGLQGADWRQPTVVITARDDRASFDEASRLGARAFFQKPFDMANLLRVVGSLTASDGSR